MRSNFSKRTGKAKSWILAILALLLFTQQAILALPVQSANAHLTTKKSQLPFAYIPYIYLAAMLRTVEATILGMNRPLLEWLCAAQRPWARHNNVLEERGCVEL